MDFDSAGAIGLIGFAMPDEPGPTGPILLVVAVVAAALGAYFYAPSFVLGTACGILAVLAAECAVVLYFYSVLVNKTSESLASTAGTPEERRADTEGIPLDATSVAEVILPESYRNNTKCQSKELKEQT